jgi:hypothetical protein
MGGSAARAARGLLGGHVASVPPPRAGSGQPESSSTRREAAAAPQQKARGRFQTDGCRRRKQGSRRVLIFRTRTYRLQKCATEIFGYVLLHTYSCQSVFLRLPRAWPHHSVMRWRFGCRYRSSLSPRLISRGIERSVCQINLVNLTAVSGTNSPRGPCPLASPRSR